MLAFWFGESDEPTPQFIRDAAMRSLAEGETFYSHNLGLPELRRAIADYIGTLHPHVASDRIAVTSSGVNALMLAMQALVGAGRRSRRGRPGLAQPDCATGDPRRDSHSASPCARTPTGRGISIWRVCSAL